MNGAEIMKNAMDEFKNIQEYMLLAREEDICEAKRPVSCIKSIT